MSMASNYDHIMIIVDGLDECGRNTRNFVELLASLNTDMENCNIKTLFLSRHEQDIMEILKDYAQVSIAANIVDLRLYVGAEIEVRTRRKELRIKDQSMKDHIMERLVEGAERMFRWVACQMDYLCELTNDTARRKALNSLPPTLNATYERILRQVNNKSQDAQKLVQRTLQWIVQSRTALSITALREAVSINIGDTNLDRDAILPEDEIFRCCSSLVRRSAVGPGLELAHFTVKECLVGLGECQGNEFRLFRINPVDTELYIAEVCLTYLNLQDFSDWNHTGENASQRSEEEYAFRKYAVEFWAEHSRRHLSETNILSLAQKLLHPTKPNTFLNWACEYAQRKYKWNVHKKDNNSEAILLFCLSSTSPLHHAAMLALPAICAWLIENGCQVNQQSRLGTPLHCALLGCIAIKIPVSKPSINYLIESQFSTDEYQDMAESTIEIILGAGADVHYPLSIWCPSISPLYIAVCRKYWTTSTALLKKGAIVDSMTADQLKTWSHGYPREFPDIKEPPQPGDERKYAALRKFAQESDIYFNNTVEVVSFSDTCASLRVAADFGQVGSVKRILHDTSLDINSIDKRSGRTALHYAAAADHAEIVELLLQRNANCSAIDDEGNIALHCSVGSGGWHCMSMLLKQKPDITLKDHAGFSVWHLAASEDNIEALKVLERYMECCKRSAITVTHGKSSPMPSYSPDSSAKPTVPNDFYKGQDLAIRSLHGATPIHIAARTGSVRAVRFIVDHGFDIAAQTSDGSSALHCAVDVNKREVSDDIVRLLLDAGADPCRARTDGMRPIYVLIERIMDTRNLIILNRQASVLPRLARCSGTLHQSNTENLTGLHQICRRTSKVLGMEEESLLAVRILLDHGADPGIPDGLGRTAFNVLVETWKEKSLREQATKEKSMSTYVEMINMFLDSGSEGNAKAKMCNNPYVLFLALRFREEELAHKLLDQFHDVDTEIDEINSLSAIQAACRYSSSHPLLKKLIHKSRAQSDPTRLGSTLIREACAGDHTTSTSVVLQLLDAGLDPNGRSLGGETALMVAARTRNPALIDTLLSHGAYPMAIDNNGWSMLHHACKFGDVAVLPMLNRLTLDLTATVRAKIGRIWLQGATALHIAASHEDPRILKYILDNEYFSDIDRTTDFTQTALYVASYMGRGQNVALLLVRGADATICDSTNSLRRSPLHIAAGLGHQEAVMAFVDHGCDTQIKDRLGLTPESIARSKNHLDVANILK